jgi:hypothetical protein
MFHTEEVLRTNQFLAFDPAASVLKSKEALVALKKKGAKKKKEEEEARAAVGWRRSPTERFDCLV